MSEPRFPEPPPPPRARRRCPSDLEIAQRATMQPIEEIAAAAGINADALEFYGRYKAKIDPAKLRRRAARAPGKVVLVSAMSPTPGRRGQVHHHRGTGGLPGPRGPQGDDRAARALARTRSWA